MKVMKFGGSSVADASRIRDVIEIIASHHARERVCAVFSAMKGVTDQLIDAAAQASGGVSQYRLLVDQIRDRYLAAAEILCAPDPTDTVAEIKSLGDQLASLLRGVELVRECSGRTLDLVLGFGERMNCTLIAAAMKVRDLPARYVDAREMIVTDASHGHAIVDQEASAARIKNVLSGDDLPVVTGFIAATQDGVSTTLGRNGSDYTASIVGAGADASAIEIWTDVDGVYSADPRYVQDAFVLPQISYKEAMELSYFGAKVIHPSTMVPAVHAETPIWIKNTLNPTAPGTRITAESSGAKEITGLASVEDVALVNVEGGGMVGLPGVAGRLFSTLAAARINIIMISQASSEHSICFIVSERDVERATSALEMEFQHELHYGSLERVNAERGLEIVAVIGERMRGKAGISGKLFHALGEAQINVLAIAQGSSEMNISFVVYNREREHALNAVHSAFFAGGSE
ncbi:MAG: aspartate kinase [Spirochaetales bacterium]